MVTIAIALMIVVAVGIVAWPFVSDVRALEPVFGKSADPAFENLVVQRDATYAAIKDLEFDHAMGKLSDADYGNMRSKYESKAVALLQELDKVKGAPKRAHRPDSSGEAIEREVKALRQKDASSLQCAKCGTPHGMDDAFCAKCGAGLRGAKCTVCGTRAAPGDKFCARCGSKVTG